MKAITPFLLLFVHIISLNAQTYTPIPLSGFNQDVVAEGTGNSALNTTSVEMDAVPISNFVMCTQEFATANSFTPANTYGLPDDGLFVDGIRSYQWAPYDQNNVLYLFPTETGTLNLFQPAHYTNISIMALSTEGSSTVTLTFNFADGTSQTTTKTIFDWFDNQASPFNSFGRLKRKDGPFFFGTDYAGAENGKPVFAILDFTIPCNKALTSIAVKNTTLNFESTSFRSFILAVSGLKIVLSPTVTTFATDTTICAGKPITFTSTITNGGTLPKYAWKVNGLTVDTNASFTTTTLQNNDVVTCELTSNLPCASPTSILSTPISIHVNPLLLPVSTITASDTMICAGASVTCSVIPTNGGPNPQYIWKVNGITRGSDSTFSSTNFKNNDLVTCVLISNATCASPTTVTSKTIRIYVNPLLVPSDSITATDTAICDGTEIKFNVTFKNGGLLPAFQWLVNDQPMEGSTTDSYSSSSLKDGDQVQCVLTSNETCLSRSKDTSNGISIKVTPVYQLSIQAADTLNSNDPPSPLAGTPANGIFTSGGVNIGRSFNPQSFGPGIHRITYSLPQNGCSLPVAKDIVVRQLPCDLNPETMFTPNGDGKNDVWEIGIFNSNCILKAEVNVYNRWGKRVYNSDRYSNNWDGKADGKDVSAGTYFFTITYTTVGNPAALQKNGTLTILR